jgi:hypothetical protein
VAHTARYDARVSDEVALGVRNECTTRTPASLSSPPNVPGSNAAFAALAFSFSALAIAFSASFAARFAALLLCSPPAAAGAAASASTAGTAAAGAGADMMDGQSIWSGAVRARCEWTSDDAGQCDLRHFAPHAHGTHCGSQSSDAARPSD